MKSIYTAEQHNTVSLQTTGSTCYNSIQGNFYSSSKDRNLFAGFTQTTVSEKIWKCGLNVFYC